jgi:CTP:molybdopterin cytidylyltransferase MocA
MGEPAPLDQDRDDNTAGMRIMAVLLAAGEGRRIGGPKALLRIGSESFLSRCVHLLSRPSVSEVVMILGQQADRVAEEAAGGLRATIVRNPRYADGMLSSVLAGVAAAESGGADAVLLHPVDHPLAAPETVDRVVEALLAGAQIAVPTHQGRRGHPGGFARAAWPALRAASPAEGARAVLAQHPEWIVHVPGDPMCVIGIDTPADYERWVSRDLS